MRQIVSWLPDVCIHSRTCKGCKLNTLTGRPYGAHTRELAVASYLTSLLFVCLGATLNCSFGAAMTAVIPPDLFVGLGCIVGRGAYVVLVAPLSSDLWKERLK